MPTKITVQRYEGDNSNIDLDKQRKSIFLNQAGDLAVET